MISRHLTASAAVLAATLAAAAPALAQGPAAADSIDQRLAKYTTVRLTADVAALTANERRMIPLLIDAAKEMDAIFWRQAYGDRDALLRSLTDPRVRRFAEINYGPWDRLAGNASPSLPARAPSPRGRSSIPPTPPRPSSRPRSPGAARAPTR
jgi:hypothetical protein